ncbi:hypothetical protein M0D21_06745 [Aquimarina sp. D1M17]|uniref:DUF6702 family protein n=1 Tax=Aquimarina acroporae TaxID=2937283 RepID=UPI0020BFA935|nr:DUF6702 family protein [Aquimarina acroporae]MCK8521255.1 hypothetical protein [Aquimarina acroporae]
MKTKNKFYKIIYAVCLLFVSTSFNSVHPIKISSSLIEFNPKTNMVDVECRVFIDDFTFSMNDTFTKNLNVSNLSEEDKTAIEKYFKRYYKIYINDILYSLEYSSSEVFEEHNVVSFKFIKDVPPIKEGDQICIDNTLFFEDFGILQSNRITVRVPPFIAEDHFEITTVDEPIPLNL